MKKILSAVLLGAAFLVPVAAQAGGNYLKLGVGESKYDGGVAEKNELATSLAYGFSFDKNVGIELGYINFGTLKAFGGNSSTSIEREAFYLAGVSSFPVTNALSVFGKLGLAANRSEENFSVAFAQGAESNTKTKAMVGVGATYNLTKDIAGVAEYQYFGKFNDIRASALTFGVRYGFK
jgi:OOP family OmpA-OmpF porin